MKPCPFCGRRVFVQEFTNRQGASHWRLHHDCGGLRFNFLMLSDVEGELERRWDNRQCAPPAPLDPDPKSYK